MLIPTHRNKTMASPLALKCQGGFSLIVSLLMLVVIIILGVGAANMALNEERSARNDRDRQVAFQAAEAALRDAEQEILGTAIGVACGEANQFRGRTVDICFDGKNVSNGFAAVGCSAGTSPGLCSPSTSTTPTWQSAFYGSPADFVTYGSFTGRTYPAGTAGTPAIAPRYIIEWVPKNNTTDDYSKEAIMYRITALGFGTNADAQVVLQSLVNVTD